MTGYQSKRAMAQEPVACVYKATTKKGETAHFGEYSAAKAWAGWGSVESVPLKTLTLIPKSIKPCTTCEALARTVMLDQTSHDTPPLTESMIKAGLAELEAIRQTELVGDYELIKRLLEAAHGIKENT